MLRHRPGPVALLAAAGVLPAALLEALGSSTVPVGGLEHLVLVGVTALVAALASGRLTATAVRRRDAQTALLGTAFATMTSMLAVPGDILRKPGKLTDAEYDAVKRHPAAGVRLLRELGGFPAGVHALVGEHHERLDGGGYPYGRTGAELETGPRILAVCDVYDALVSDRVYREAWTPERALALLREQTGTAFDGACVESLARVVGLAVAAPVTAERAVGAPAVRLA